MDIELLLAINGFHTEFLDSWMWNITQKSTWIVLYVAMLAVLIIRYHDNNTPPLRSWLRITLVFVGFAACVLLSDQLSGIIKHAMERPRPTHEAALSGVLNIVNGYRGGRYGFPSAHAANTFSAALLFVLITGDWKNTAALMTWVGLNCYSRVYLGVHYPSDILGGLALGTIIALGVYGTLRWSKVIKKEDSQHKEPLVTNYIVCTIMLITTAVCAI